MTRRFTRILAAFALLVGLTIPLGMWGQQTTWSHEFVSPDAVSNNSITVDGVTWSIATTVGAGSPTIDKGNSYGKYCLKFGTGKNHYFSNITFSTDYFNNFNVQSVTIQVLHNTSKSGTFTATQGDVTIGTSTNTIGTAWTNVTVNTNPGNGGTLSFSYSPDACAVNLHAITVTYTVGTQPTTYTVTYNGNSNTSGTVPTDNNAYGNGDNVTVLGNTGELAKTGHTFGGWCLNEGGTGTVYGPGTGQTATYTISANTTFYAKWTPNTHNITMPTADAYGSYSADATSNVPYGTTVTLTYTPATGYENYVATWSLNSEVITGNTFSMPDEDVTITVSVAEMVDYATLPFAYDGNGTGVLPNGFTVSGLGTYSSSPAMKFDGTGDYAILKFNERPGTLTFDIKGNAFSGGTFTVQTSEDGETYTDLKTYTELGDTQHESFTNLGENVRYIKWIYTNKSSGNVALGNITLAEYVTIPTITVNPATVNVDAISDEEDYFEGTLDLTWENLEITDFSEDFAIQYYDAEGEELADDPNWIMVDLATQDPNIGEGYLVSYMIEENEGPDARTAYFKVFALGDEDYVYSNMVTVNQAAPVVPPTPGNWVLTNLADLTEDDIFVIVGTDADDDTFALPNDGGASTAPSATAITIVEGTISGEPAEELQWNLSGNATDGYTFYPNGYTAKWLYCTDSNNGVRVGTNENNVFTMSENGYLHNTATGRYIGIYNSQDWRCYTSINNNIAGQTFAFYKKVEPTPAGISLEIAADQWYLIASPVGTVDIDDVENLTSGTHGLYSFDQTGGTDGKEWRNYKTGAFSQLEAGKGYLYINENSCTLTFPGTAYSTPDGSATFPIDYYTSNPTTSFRGLNLVGNPFNEDAAINLPFYKMNATTDEIEAASGLVHPMEGVFVVASENVNSVTFQTGIGYGGGDEKFSLNLTQNRGNVIDRAIVRFDEGGQLPKVQLFENSTKVYIPQNGKDYAVVRSEGQGELPVNFRASENGTYTLSMDVENMDMNYLHLIDNMTGMDIDLLQTPSYTFEAKVNDYESRFRLVFAANNEDGASTGSAAFAFYSNGSWIINNASEATLQVVDLTGRILSSETVNGSVSKTINAVPGVYMLRLINGDNVNVQKIVVR